MSAQAQKSTGAKRVKREFGKKQNLPTPTRLLNADVDAHLGENLPR